MHDEQGREIPDPTPVAIPTGVGRPESLADTIRRMVRNEHFVQAMGGAETFDEANDFDLEEEDLYSSPYEEKLMSEEDLKYAEEAIERRDSVGVVGKGKAEPSPTAVAGGAPSAGAGGQNGDNTGSGGASGAENPSGKAK